MISGASPEILVLGAGLIGRAAAYYVARAGVRARLLDADANPSATSRASLGVLTHANGKEDALGSFYRDAHALHAELAPELAEEAGVDVGWRELGGIDLVVSEDDEAEARQGLAFNLERGCAAEWLNRRQVRELEPGVADEVAAGLYFPGDHRVDPEALAVALLAAARRLGAEVHTGAKAVSVESTPAGSVAVEVRRTDGTAEVLGADAVVLAAGAWSGAIAAPSEAEVAVRPIRGQQARFQCPSPPRHVLRHGGYHALPAGDLVVAGATVEEAGFDASVTPEAAASFGGALSHMLGAEAELVEQRAGLRPKPRKGRPVIGPLPGCEQVMVTTGHYKSGVLMGPLTGQVVARWVLTGAPGRDMGYFAVQR